MDEKVKGDEKQVMLVKEAGDGKLKAVKEIDPEGNIKTVEPTQANLANLLNVNTNDPAVEAFFKKFMEELQNPTKTGISEVFIMAESILNKLIKIDLDPKIVENYRVDPEDLLAEDRFEPMDLSKIDREDMVRKGIRMEDLEPHLKAMSYGYPSHGMIEMNPEMEPGGIRVATKGRVLLEEQADGSLKVVPRYYREQCDLDAPFHGVLLDEEAKRNITETRHAGKVIDLELEPGKMTPCYVSRDKWTNTLVPMPVSEFEKRESLKNADLTAGKQLDFYSGGKVLLEGYTTRTGYKRDAYIQIDASERSIEFDRSGLDQRRYQDYNREVYRRNHGMEGPAGERTLFIPQRIYGKEVPEHAYKQWSEAVNFPEKQKEVKAVYMTGLKLPYQSEPGDRWVKPDFEGGRIRTYRWNPDQTRRQDTKQKQSQSQQEQLQPRQETRRRASQRSKQNKSKGIGGL